MLGINPFDQPNVQEAKDNTGKVLEQYASDGALPEVEEADDEALTRAARRRRSRRTTWRSWATSSRRDAFDAAIAELRAAIRDATRCTTTFGYGPRFLHSTGQLHKGGPPTGRFLQLVHDGDEDVDDPGGGLHVRHAEERAGDRRPADAARHGLPAERVRLEGDPVEGVRRPHRADQGDCRLMQIGFVGLGRMGGNMVHRIHRDSDHEVRRLRLLARTPSARPSRTARPAPPRSRTSCRKLDAPRTVWIMVPAGEPTTDTVNKLAELLERATRSSTAATSRWTDDKARAAALEPKGIHYVDVGTSGGVWGLQVGYCMMVGGPDEAVERLAPILDVLAPPADRRARPGLGPLRARPARATT